MSLEMYSKREELLDLREKLMEAKMQRANGAKRYSIEEVSLLLRGLLVKDSDLSKKPKNLVKKTFDNPLLV